MFSSSDREAIRAELIARAEADPRISGAALVGSAARGAEDEWSDIDLVLQLGRDTDEADVVADWTNAIGSARDLADTLDVFAGGIRYRVFLLTSSLQIDVSFWPHDEFRPTDAAFQLLFGTANDPTRPSPIDTDQTIGMGWLYAIHARSAVMRGRCWQATMMLDELRKALITLKCVRAGLNPWHGREVDRLPSEDLAELEASRAPNLEAAAIEESRTLLARQFLAEIQRHDRERFERLQPPFAELMQTAR